MDYSLVIVKKIVSDYLDVVIIFFRVISMLFT